MKDFHDRMLSDMVTERILQDDRLARESIKAEADGGIVRLVGLVSSKEQKELAVQVARGVSGVQCVKDFIEVR